MSHNNYHLKALYPYCYVHLTRSSLIYPVQLYRRYRKIRKYFIHSFSVHTPIAVILYLRDL